MAKHQFQARMTLCDGCNLICLIRAVTRPAEVKRNCFPACFHSLPKPSQLWRIQLHTCIDTVQAARLRKLNFNVFPKRSFQLFGIILVRRGTPRVKKSGGSKLLRIVPACLQYILLQSP